jgi:hypothetical protein
MRMSQRTYAPTLVRLIQRLLVYVARHQGSLQATLTSTQYTQLQAIVTAGNTFVGIPWREGP